jgi:hypothetical protein
VLDDGRQRVHERHARIDEIAPRQFAEEQLLRPRKVHVMVVAQVVQEHQAERKGEDAGRGGEDMHSGWTELVVHPLVHLFQR